MARASRRPVSKRRAAALKFLSNISFENSAHQLEEPSQQTVVIEDEKCPSSLSVGSGGNEQIFEEYVSAKYVEANFMASVSAPFRERQADLKHRAQKCKEVKITNVNNLKNCKNERIMLVSASSKIPFYVFSFLPYKKNKSKGDGKKESGGRRRNLSGSRPLSSFIDTLDPYDMLGLEKFENGQMISYQQLLLPSLPEKEEVKSSAFQDASDQVAENMGKTVHMSRCMSIDLGASAKNLVASSSPPFAEIRGGDLEDYGFGCFSQIVYSPFLLDDPELMSGKHRTVLTFPSYRASVIDYVRPSELKKELNEKFKEKFPHIQLTLSKLRSLKKEMKNISKTEKCVDLLTVAQSYVYFEKLILRKVINKTNRKVCAAVCLLLSAKMNDTKGIALKQLLEKLESIFRLSRKDILALEFPAVVALEFSLHVPTWEVLPHFQRLNYES
ncbi:hypothetical protein V9T40_005580 [Parthenolecanium corni]|uniref:Cyclin N-terminal domain-containing protein n=1 Tax=Parthenolecanium corni TaxID=536013 RepID=A0AAN9U277_9HEMI